MCSVQRTNSNTSENSFSQKTLNGDRKLDLSGLNFNNLKYGPEQVERTKNYRRELVLKIKRSFEDDLP